MRKQIYLNGEWDFMPDYAGRSPQQAIRECVWEKEKIRVPSSWKWKINRSSGYEPYDMFLYPEHWNDADSGVLGRSFRVRPEAGQRIFLIFKGVLQSFQVYINDVCVLESRESFLPEEIDITDAVDPDRENSLKVWCGPFATVDTPVGKKQTVPPGSWFAQGSMGIWQDVFLEYRSARYLHSPCVRTSFRKGLLEAEILLSFSGSRIDVKNRGDGMDSDVFSTQESVHFQIVDGKQIVKTFEGVFCGMENGAAVYRGSVRWDDPILWMPDHPHLYTLRAERRSGGNAMGAPEDTLDARFGFQEVWLEGCAFYLNGIRINLRGDSWHYQGFVYQTKEYALNWYRLCKDSGMNFVRLHAMPYPDFFLEAADETGMLIMDESAIYGSSKKMQADDEAFLLHCQSHLEKLVKRDRNHPSVILWSMQNEMRWVDGRDGYKSHMKKLIAAIRALDPGRPISFDGDNRLVDPEDMEIVSMHYNIDGTIASWDKSKPLAFGEHGKWHYVSPQVACGLVGGKAYESIDSCLLNMAMDEALFIEYARREDVTAICPFNVGYYMMEPMPPEDRLLSWDSLEGPGVRPKIIRQYSTTLDNGLLKNCPVYEPNISYKPIFEAFRPVAVIADEYDRCFFDDRLLTRHFSVYNDTYSVKKASLDYRMKDASGKILKQGRECFEQIPGERRSVLLEFMLPALETGQGRPSSAVFTLELDLAHEGRPVFSLQKQYKIHSLSAMKQGRTSDRKILFVGDPADHEKIASFAELTLYQGELCAKDLAGTDVLIIGRNDRGRLKRMQPELLRFVEEGGFLFILEQDREAPGELILSGRKFHRAVMTEPDHPIFKGLFEEDFAGWGKENIHAPASCHAVVNAFEKPVHGDVNVLLECGDGDFGCGGLLWAAMLEYRVGKGRVLLQQMDLTERLRDLPLAGVLLQNILGYASKAAQNRFYRTGFLSDPAKAGPAFPSLIQGVGASETAGAEGSGILTVAPDDITDLSIPGLRKFAEGGGRLLVLPMDPKNFRMAGKLAGRKIKLEKRAVYQVKAVHPTLCRGILPHDLYHFEKATYAHSNKINRIIAEYAVCMEGIENVLVSVGTPWEDLFVNGLADELIKQASIRFAKDRSVAEHCYCGYFPLGKGGILFCQLDVKTENDKLLRIYSRLLANMGAEIRTNLLTYVKEEKDFSIGTYMALPYDPRNDYALEEAYFSSPSYVLNHLGEGVYGWMTRTEKKNGFVRIGGSSDKTYFLTVFVVSEINRNPQKRIDGELPDSSIVPDLLLTANCGVKLFVNGKRVFENGGSGRLTDYKIEDVVLDKGVNRFAAACFGGDEDILFNCCFVNKFGDFIKDLRYDLTMD